ncbi:hypothetical protein [Sinomonas sp. G460-2]|uniref:hypothetical protein n=1 Tax=Sinomonas sp. G460-2 TaxID=3393464 RepID=UPI0039EEA859
MKRRDGNGVDWAGVDGTAWDWTREHGFPELTVEAAHLDDDELRQAIKTGEYSVRGTGPWLTSTRASLLARLILAAHPDAVYLAVEQEGGRVARAAVYGGGEARIAEILPTPPEEAEPGSGDEASRLLSLIDPGEANPLWAQFPRTAGGAATPRAFDLVGAAEWSPLVRHLRPSE